MEITKNTFHQMQIDKLSIWQIPNITLDFMSHLMFS
jgi:hypothetical protein